MEFKESDTNWTGNNTQGMLSLNDVYRILKETDSPSQTSYILQFLWQDLTSSYDIVGSYCTSSDLVDEKFTLSCVLETVKLFQTHGLKTSLLVCDGNPANLTTVKDILELIQYYLTQQMICMQSSHG